MSQNKGVNISKKDTNYKWVDCEKFQSMETQQKNEIYYWCKINPW